jgi:hypothetical protein
MRSQVATAIEPYRHIERGPGAAFFGLRSELIEFIQA